MAKKPSRDMLTTGLVGGYLLASAWGVLLSGVLIVLVGGGTGTMSALDVFESGFATLMITLGIVFVLLWLGGVICEAIGWVALGRLYPGMAPVIGWIEGAIPILAIMLTGITLGLAEGGITGHVIIVMQLVHFALAGMWMVRHHHPPHTPTLPATLGYALALIGGLTLYVLGLAEQSAEIMTYVLLITLLAGATIAHLGTAIMFGRSRALADSLETF